MKMSEADIRTFFGTRDIYAKRLAELGIENRMGPIKKRKSHERPFYTGIENAQLRPRATGEEA
jgi:hypothetical protein